MEFIKKYWIVILVVIVLVIGFWLTMKPAKASTPSTPAGKQSITLSQTDTVTPVTVTDSSGNTYDLSV